MEENLRIDDLQGLFLERQNVIDIEPNEPKIDRALALRFSPKNRGSVRLSLGLFYTKEEWEKRREELVSRPLP